METPHNPTREEIMQELFENMAAMKRGLYSHAQKSLQDVPIPRAQLELLFAIHHLRPVSFKDVASNLQLTPGAVSQLVEALEQAGYVARHTDEADRRIQFLTLTKKGVAIVDSVQKKRNELMNSVMQELSDTELAIWLRVQRKMIQQFSNQ